MVDTNNTTTTIIDDHNTNSDSSNNNSIVVLSPTAAITKLHHRHYCNSNTNSTNNGTIKSKSIVSYGSISEMNTTIQQHESAPLVDATATTTGSNHHHHHHHRRRSTNTDIASIFHNFSIPNLFHHANWNNTTPSDTTTAAPPIESSHHSSSLSYTVIVDDEEDNEYPAPLLLRVPDHTTTTTTSRSLFLRCCCSRRNRRSGHTTTTPTSSSKNIFITSGAILNLCSATLGAGILALPYTLLQSGFIYGILLLCIAAIATERSIYILITVIEHYKHYHYSNTTSATSTSSTNEHHSSFPTSNHQCNSYESLSENVLDKSPQNATTTTTTTTKQKYTTISYRRTIEIAMLLFCCGCAIGYIMAIMDIIEKFHFLNKYYTILIVWMFIMVPLSLLQNVQSLQYASAIGIISIVTLIIAAFVHYIQHHNQRQQAPLESSNNLSMLLKVLSHYRKTLRTTTATATATPNDSNNKNNIDDDNVSLWDFLWPINGWVSILTSGPVVLFAFSCQPNVCSIYDELIAVDDDNDSDDDDRNQRLSDGNNGTVGMNSTTTTTATSSNKKLRLMHHVTIVAVAICATLYCSISIIALADFGTNVQPNMLSCYSTNNNDGGSSSTLIQIATAAMAIAIVMAFPLNIFPARVTLIGLWYNYCQHQQRLVAAAVTTSDDNIGRNTGISLHGILPHEGLTAALLDGEGNDENLSQTTTNIVNDANPENGVGSASDVPDNNNNPPFNRTVHVVATLILTTSTLISALILPNISVVFGLLGGTASSWLGFCVPGLLGIQMSKNERLSGEPTRYGLLFTSWTLLVGGIVIGVLTTGVTIYNTLKH